MGWRLVIRRNRVRPALAAGIAVTVALTLLAPLPGVAETTLQFRDDFQDAAYWGNDGTHNWSTWWIEVGELTDPRDGSISIENSQCASGSCLSLGRRAGNDVSIQRTFFSSGADSVTLSFDYERHLHASGGGTVRLLTSRTGYSNWVVVDSWQLTESDAARQFVSYDITAVASPFSTIRFELTGNANESHMNIDDVEVLVTYDTTAPPAFNQDLGDRDDEVGDTVSIDASASDPDSAALTYTASGLPAGVAIDPDSGLISGTITSAVGSPLDVEIVVKDPDDNGDTDTFVWTVTAPSTTTTTTVPPTTTTTVPPTTTTTVPPTTTTTVPPTTTTTVPPTTTTTVPPTTTTTVPPTTTTTVPPTTTTTVPPTTTTTVPPTTTTTVPPTTTTTVPPTTTTTVPPTTTTTVPPTTTTTVPPTTTTTVPPTTTTTVRPETGPPTTTAPSTTTTTTPETTTVPTTTTQPQVIAPVPPTTTTTAPPERITPERATEMKDELVSVALPSPPPPASGPDNAPPIEKDLDPIRGLAVTFGSAVETLQTHLLSSVLLGVVLAVLLMLGVEERERTSHAS